MNEQQTIKNSNAIKTFFSSMLGRVTVTVVSAIIIFGLILIGVSTEAMPIVLIIAFGCTYFGWKALNRITPNIFLILPLGGWVIYFLIKGVLAFFIGYVIAPFQIGRMISAAAADTVNERL